MCIFYEFQEETKEVGVEAIFEGYFFSQEKKIKTQKDMEAK